MGRRHCLELVYALGSAHVGVPTVTIGGVLHTIGRVQFLHHGYMPRDSAPLVQEVSGGYDAPVGRLHK